MSSSPSFPLIPSFLTSCYLLWFKRWCPLHPTWCPESPRSNRCVPSWIRRGPTRTCHSVFRMLFLGNHHSMHCFHYRCSFISLRGAWDRQEKELPKYRYVSGWGCVYAYSHPGCSWLQVYIQDRGCQIRWINSFIHACHDPTWFIPLLLPIESETGGGPESPARLETSGCVIAEWAGSEAVADIADSGSDPRVAEEPFDWYYSIRGSQGFQTSCRLSRVKVGRCLLVTSRVAVMVDQYCNDPSLVMFLLIHFTSIDAAR